MNGPETNVYDRWMSDLLKGSGGERAARLRKGLGHGSETFLKNVWWPAFGSFEGLFPEFELRDYKDGWRYLDFAYLAGGYRVCIEIDGFGPHWRDIGRWQFADQLQRQNHLVPDGWLVFRFAYDSLVDRPRQCHQLLQQMMGKLGIGLAAAEKRHRLSPTEQA